MKKEEIQKLDTVGKRLNAWRKAKTKPHLTLSGLTKLIKTTQGSLSDLENDVSLPSATTLANIAEHTDLNIVWLLTGKGPVHQEEQEETNEQYMQFLHWMRHTRHKKILTMVTNIFNDENKDKLTKLNGFLEGLL